MEPIRLSTFEELRDHPEAILVVFGMEESVPYFYCPVRQICCSESTLRVLLSDLSSLTRSSGESHRFELAPAGASYDWDFENTFRVSHSLTFSPRFLPVESYLQRIIGGEATNLVDVVGNAEPRLLWELCSGQWDESLYLRLIAAFGPLHRRYASDDELIRRAIERKWMDVIQWLRTIGARFDVPDTDGAYPLHIATRHGNVEAVKFILSLGVNPVPRTPEGKSPLDMLCPDQHQPELHAILWPLEWPAAAARQRKLDEVTRPT